MYTGRSQRIAEAMSDSILVPPPKLLGGRPSISTTRNSLAIISNEVRPTSSEPDVPCLLPSTSIRDQYGFLKASHHIQKSQYEAWSSSYTAVQERRRKKWYALMQFHELQTFNPTSFPRRSPKTQRFIRKGIPSGWRGAAWYHYSDADKYRAKDPTLYHNLIARSSTSDLSNIDNETIERDLHRTFPENIHFKDPASSVHETPLLISLRRLLRAFAINNPKIGYCQSLNFIGGLLLLFLPEEKAFWMLHVISRDYLPGTHEISLTGANTDLRILMALLKEQLPGIWTLITTGTPPHQSDGEKIGRQKLPPVSLCCASWFMSLFIGTLPIECTLRDLGHTFLRRSAYNLPRGCGHFPLVRARSQSSQLTLQRWHRPWGDVPTYPELSKRFTGHWESAQGSSRCQRRSKRRNDRYA